MTTLSVIIPCFDVAAYVPALLASLRRNVAAGIEFILVDDASQDGTAELLAAGAVDLPGARVVTSTVNRGLSAARNLGLAAARGEYLAFLDGDDFVAPGYFAELLATIRRLRCAMLRTDHVQVRGRERVVHRISHGPRGVVMSPRDAILPADRPSSVDAPYAWAGIFHRRVAEAGLLTFDETLRTCEDRSWCWRLHLRVDSFAVVGLTGLFYRRGVASSLTQQADERQLDFFSAYDQVLSDVRADPEADRFELKAVRCYCAIICHHLKLAERYSAPVQAELRHQAQRRLAGFEADLYESVVRSIDQPRRSILDELRHAA